MLDTGPGLMRLAELARGLDVTPSALHYHFPGGKEEVVSALNETQLDQFISLLDLGGPSFALADHDDHIHVGFRPVPFPAGTATGRSAVPSPAAWRALLTRVLPLATDGRPRPGGVRKAIRGVDPPTAPL